MPEDADPPLLLVPGYMDAVTAPFSDALMPRWQQLADNLRDRGYDGPLEPVDLGLYGTTVGSVRRYAEPVAAAAEQAYREYGTPVNAINHSRAGLSARWAVEQDDADAYIDTLVTLGTPHQGTPAAILGWLTPGGRDMIPGSRFLTALNRDGLAEDVDYVAVYSDHDQAFPGAATENAALPDADHYENAVNIKVTGAGHLDLLTNDAVLDTYYERLVDG